jgi:hypothetical protein
VRAPLVFYLGTLSQAVPPVVAVAARRRIRGARAWVLAWCLVLLAFDLVQMWLARRGQRNLWIVYVDTPLQVSLALWAFSCWQTRELSRLTLRLAVVPFLAVWAALLTLESTADFSRVSQPMASLVGLCAAAFTLLVRSYEERGSLVRQDWFWMGAGMALYFGLTVVIGPLSALLVGGDIRNMLVAYQLRAAVQIVALLLVAVGMACPNAT